MTLGLTLNRWMLHSSPEESMEILFHPRGAQPDLLAPEGPAQTPASGGVDVDQTGVRVLMVEDESDGRELLMDVL